MNRRVLSLLKDCPPELMGSGGSSNAGPKNYKIVYTSRREVYEASNINRNSESTSIVPLIPLEVVTDALATGAGGGARPSDGTAWMEVLSPSNLTQNLSYYLIVGTARSVQHAALVGRAVDVEPT